MSVDTETKLTQNYYLDKNKIWKTFQKAEASTDFSNLLDENRLESIPEGKPGRELPENYLSIIPALATSFVSLYKVISKDPKGITEMLEGLFEQEKRHQKEERFCIDALMEVLGHGIYHMTKVFAPCHDPLASMFGGRGSIEIISIGIGGGSLSEIFASMGEENGDEGTSES